LHDLQAERRAALTASKHQARRLFVAITTLVFALDLATKEWALNYLQGREPVAIIGNFLKLTYATNSGAAFSFLTDATLLLSFLKLAVVGLILFYIREVTNTWWSSALALLLGGVIGNLYDRALRDPGLWRGEVIDWIQIPNWPVFNIADSAIVTAGVLMTILAMRDIQPKERNGAA
jgi:signal peptidase II